MYSFFFLFFLYTYNSRRKYRISSNLTRDGVLPATWPLHSLQDTCPERVHSGKTPGVQLSSGDADRLPRTFFFVATSSIVRLVFPALFDSFEKYIYFHIIIFSVLLYSLSDKDMQIFQANFQF